MFDAAQGATFVRYAVARYAAFPVIWSISGDDIYVQDLDKWERIGAALEEADPYRHMTTNHLGSGANWHFLHHNSGWHDFHMIQTGHRRDRFLEPAALGTAYRRLQPPKPMINGESWYEGLHLGGGWWSWYDEHVGGNTLDEQAQARLALELQTLRDHPEQLVDAFRVRWSFWVSVLSGATMGHGYGGQGIWNWKPPVDYGETYVPVARGPVWEEALSHPGSEQVAIGTRFLRSLPWWTLEPRPELVHQLPAPAEPSNVPCCAAAPNVWVIYLPDGTGTPILRGLPRDRWRARWFDPRTAAVTDTADATPDNALRWHGPQPPSREDWVLVLTR
jgi:hypothetical protein